MLNLEVPKYKLVQIVLAGQLELKYNIKRESAPPETKTCPDCQGSGFWYQREPKRELPSAGTNDLGSEFHGLLPDPRGQTGSSLL